MSDSSWSSDVRSPSGSSAAPGESVRPALLWPDAPGAPGAVEVEVAVTPAPAGAVPPVPADPLPEHAARAPTQARTARADAILDFMLRWSPRRGKPSINKG